MRFRQLISLYCCGSSSTDVSVRHIVLLLLLLLLVRLVLALIEEELLDVRLQLRSALLRGAAFAVAGVTFSAVKRMMRVGRRSIRLSCLVLLRLLRLCLLLLIRCTVERRDARRYALRYRSFTQRPTESSATVVAAAGCEGQERGWGSGASESGWRG